MSSKTAIAIGKPQSLLGAIWARGVHYGLFMYISRSPGRALLAVIVIMVYFLNDCKTPKITISVFRRLFAKIIFILLSVCATAY